jgi:hypothetical protein
MNRPTIFFAAVAAALVCLIIAIIYWVGGSPLGHHIKHGVLFFGLAVVIGLFAAANRPHVARAR